MEKLLLKYDAELFKMGGNPQECKDFCGPIGLMGLKDDQNRIDHLRWMIEQLLNNEFDELKSNRWLGFIQGVMWSIKMRGILEMRDEIKGLSE